ncbi:MAG: hypothetical protein RO009_17555 [Pseudorhodoplanes sp.]|nr:hypothetical protein [Pseudorhodoplanes sp.]
MPAVQLDGFFGVFGCTHQFALCGKGGRQMAVRVGMVGINAERFAAQTDCIVNMTDLKSDHGEIVQAGRVSWVGDQDLTVKLNRLGQASGLHVLQRRRKKMLDG